MDQYAMLETSPEEEAGPLLPDGWADGTGLLSADDLNNTEDSLLADEITDESVLLGDDDRRETQTEAPTTDPATTTEIVESDTGEKADPEPDGAEEEQKPVKRIVPYKYNHEKGEFDVNSLSDDEIAEMMQMKLAYQDLKKAQEKEAYRKTYQEELDAGMTERTARIAARDAAGGHTYSLTDEEEAEQEALAPKPEPAPRATVSDREADMETLQILYQDAPADFEELPAAVRKAVNRGAPLLTAYQAYQSQQDTQAVEALRKENAILKQNAASAEKAPPVIVTGGGASPKEQEPDLFMKGFLSADSWKG